MRYSSVSPRSGLHTGKRTGAAHARRTEGWGRHPTLAAAGWVWSMTDPVAVNFLYAGASHEWERRLRELIAGLSAAHSVRLWVAKDTAEAIELLQAEEIGALFADEPSAKSHFDLARVQRALADVPLILLFQTGPPAPDTIRARWRAEELLTPRTLTAESLERAAEHAAQRRAKAAADTSRASRGRGARWKYEHLQALLNNSYDAIILTDTRAKITYVNPAFEQISGYPLEEVRGRNPRILQSGHHSSSFYEELWAKLDAGETWRGNFTNRRKDGTIYQTETTIVPLRSASGKAAGFIGIARDITGQIQLELRLKSAQRMEALGHLAGGVAHEFNNLLTIIAGEAEMSLSDAVPASSLEQSLNEILDSAERAASMTRKLLAFSRHESPRPASLSLDALIVDTERLVSRFIGEDIEMTSDHRAGVARIRADPGQIEQILIHLALFARSTMPRGGRLLVETDVAELDPDTASLIGAARPGTHVRLSVTSQPRVMAPGGSAISSEIHVTAATPAEDPPIGLASAHALASECGAAVARRQQPDGRDVIQVWFPRIADSGEYQTHQTTPPADIRAGGWTILLVEDEAAVRQVAARSLRERGYTVLEAEDAVDALHIAGTYKHPIHLLISDLILPGMNGVELSSAMTKAFPDLRVLMTTGHSGDALRHSGFGGTGHELLQKPYTPTVLARAVERLLVPEE